MKEIEPEDRQNSEKYEGIVNDLLEQISERNQRIAALNLQLTESAEREKRMNEQIAILSEEVRELKRQMSAVNKLQKMILQIRHRFLRGGKNRK